MSANQSQPRAAGEAANTPAQFPLGACMSAGDRGATIYETSWHASRVSVRIVNELYPEINPQYSAVVRACDSHAQRGNALSEICDALFHTAVNDRPAPSAATLVAIYEAARLALDGSPEQAEQARAALQAAKEGR